MPTAICDDLIKCLKDIQFIIMQDHEERHIFTSENLEQSNFLNFCWRNNFNV